MTEGRATRYFDLNIDRFLQHWGPAEAVRELIANALDEQALTSTRPLDIQCDRPRVWRIQDYGRGLQIEHLTQNESKEKQRADESHQLLGRFGVGLKDALATLDRHGIQVRIRSRHCEITLARHAKHSFVGVVTLHAAVELPTDPGFVGTEIMLKGVTGEDMETAKHYFLAFSAEEVLDSVRFGQILRRGLDEPARIYVRGLRVAEERELAFSYNITALTQAMTRALNRERSHVGRTAYAERIRAILLASESPVVAKVLAEDLTLLADGRAHGEMQAWTDVQAHACRILNATGRVVFVSAEERTADADGIRSAKEDGMEVITIPDSLRHRLEGAKDQAGNPVRLLRVYRRELAESFVYTFVPERELNAKERAVWTLRSPIIGLAGGLPRAVRDIRISETVRPGVQGGGNDVGGVWEPEHGWIVIKRSQLRATEPFAGTLLHELAHARSGAADMTREFERELTDLLGRVASTAVWGEAKHAPSIGSRGHPVSRSSPRRRLGKRAAPARPRR